MSIKIIFLLACLFLSGGLTQFLYDDLMKNLDKEWFNSYIDIKTYKKKTNNIFYICLIIFIFCNIMAYLLTQLF